MSTMRRRGLLVILAIAAASCGRAAQSPLPVTAANEWLEFDGSWNGVGHRRNIAIGRNRVGSLVDLKGTMLLTGAGRPGVGFHAEVIGLVDSETGFQGRSVWTDENGDRVFSALEGEGTRVNNRIKGTILSGTGRFEGVTGTYEFSWQSVMEAEEGAMQGRAVDLKGRVRIDPVTGGESR